MRVRSPSGEALREVGDHGVYYAHLASGEHMSAEYFRVEPGCGGSSHRHHHEQMGVMIGKPGAAHTFLIDDSEEFVVRPGDTFSIPSNEVHEVTNHSDSVVEIINFFSPGRPADFLADSYGTPTDS